MEENTAAMQDEEALRQREKKQYVKMTKTPIPKLVVGLGIPTMLSMMVTSLYNLADTYFVSRIGNDSITAAVGNLLALMSIIQAIGYTYGMGSGVLVSTLLGKRDRKGADTVASSAFFLGCASGLLIMAFGFLFLTPLMRLFGSIGAETLRYSKQYAVYILLSAPIMCMSFVLNNVLRAEGKAFLSMIGLVTGALVNVALDPLLIFTFDMGVSGAAIATCASQVLSFGILLFMFLSKRTIVRIRIRAVSRTFSVYKNIVTSGFPSFCRQILASFCSVFLNGVAYRYGMAAYGAESGGDAAQAAFNVVQKVFMLAFSMSLGIGQGYQPVLGYNYSAKRFDRVRSAYLFTLAFATALMATFAIVCGVFSKNLMGLFKLSDTATEIGCFALRLQCCTMPLLPVNFMAGLTYQVVGSKALAALLSVSRQGLFYIPAIWILPALFGLRGVQSCQSVSDACSFLFSVPFTVYFFKILKKKRLECDETAEEDRQVCVE